MGLHGLDPNQLPQPVAHAYLRLTHETSPHGIITRAFRVFEAALMQSVWIALSMYLELDEERRVPGAEKQLRGLGRPSLGHWVGALVALDKPLSDDPAWWVDLDRETGRVDADAQGTSRARNVMNELVALRNRAAHQTLGVSGIGRLVPAVLDAVEGVLAALGTTTLPPPFVVESCQADGNGSTIRRRASFEPRFTASVTPLGGTGLQPRTTIDLTSPLHKGRVYQTLPTGRHILLSPFVQRSSETGQYATTCGFSGNRLRMLEPLSGSQYDLSLTDEEVRELAPLLGEDADPSTAGQEPEDTAGGPPAGATAPLPPWSPSEPSGHPPNGWAGGLVLNQAKFEA